MSSVSFKGVYAIPINDTQNPLKNDYKNLMRNTYPLREEGSIPAYSPDKSMYYVYIQDKHDENFERLAKIHRIDCSKVDKSEVGKKVNQSVKVAEFVNAAIKEGAKHKIVEKDGQKTVTLFGDDGKTVFGVYKYDNNGVLKEVESYYNGKIQHVETLDPRTGAYKTTKMYNDRGQQVYINHSILRVV